MSRDRSYLVQTLVLPIFVIGAQYLLRGGTNVFALGSNPAHVAAIAFGVSAYALMFSAFQTLNSEGGALWILYTLPQPIATVLKQKAMLWAGVTLVYPLAIFGMAAVHTGGITLQTLGLAGIVLAGVAIYAVMATSLGIFGSNPLAQEVRQRVNPTYSYSLSAAELALRVCHLCAHVLGAARDDDPHGLAGAGPVAEGAG